MYKNYLLLFFSLIIQWLHSQSDSHLPIIPNQYIIECRPDFSPVNWSIQKKLGIVHIQPIFEELHYWVVQFDESQPLSKQLEILKSSKGIINFQHDLIATPRKLSNDPRIGEQWSIILTQVDKIWDLTTGGKTVDGQEIVVAVIDDGFDLKHEDLVANIWHNKAEIADNNLDDDKNGYVDDVDGLHVPTQSDNHLSDAHGTSVNGLIGAKGNNGVGMSGINWDIKMMLLSIKRSNGSSGGSVSNIVEAYQYVVNQRRKYNESNGQEGAFVVVTNFSGGISKIFPSAAPMWCPIYDELGKVGIINVTSVDNDNYDVELEGDMPTLCKSDFLITVTNTDMLDKKVTSSAFGNISVDMSAPGEDALSTIPDNRYRAFDGTSSSAPHVAGVAALLYSLPCNNLLKLAKTDPPAAAKEVKSVILGGVDTLTELKNITVSGGRLNALKSFILMDKLPPTFMTCPVDVTIEEEDSTYVWDEPVILDDCGGYKISSSLERGIQFRFGTTEVVLTVTDLLGNSATCTFNVTRKGGSGLPVAFLDIQKILFDDQTHSLSVEFMTGSFEYHFFDLYSITGQKIYHTEYQPLNSGANLVSIPNVQFASGFYLAVLSKAGGAIHNSEKFVIVR